MKRCIALLAALACAYAGTAGAALSKEEFRAQKDRITADYKAAKERCDALKDNAKDVCMAEARGTMKVAKAELDASQNPTPRNQGQARAAKAEAAYALAKERCDDMNGSAKDTCRKNAKAALKVGKDEARAVRAQARTDAKAAS